MLPFHVDFPELAKNETRTLVIKGGMFGLLGPPSGRYALIEHFCEVPKCDCRQVEIEVVREDSLQVMAVIRYSWEDGALALMDSPDEQSNYGEFFLDAVRWALDSEYDERLQRHYQKFRRALRKGRVLASARSAGKSTLSADERTEVLRRRGSMRDRLLANLRRK